MIVDVYDESLNQPVDLARIGEVKFQVKNYYYDANVTAEFMDIQELSFHICTQDEIKNWGTKGSAYLSLDYEGYLCIDPGQEINMYR